MLAGIGKAGGTCPPPPLPGKVVKCFDALVMTVKCSIDKLCMHYFQNIRQLLEALPQTSSGLRLWSPLGDESPRPPNLSTPGKNPLGAHAECIVKRLLCVRWK